MFKELRHFGCIIFANHYPSSDLGIPPRSLSRRLAPPLLTKYDQVQGLALTASPAARPWVQICVLLSRCILPPWLKSAWRTRAYLPWHLSPELQLGRGVAH